MEYVQLGNTGIKVSRLGFGCMTFKDVEQSTQLLLTARNAGVNYFDNAGILYELYYLLNIL